MKFLKFTTLIILCALAGAFARGENYPSRSDLLWVTNPALGTPGPIKWVRMQP